MNTTHLSIFNLSNLFKVDCNSFITNTAACNYLGRGLLWIPFHCSLQFFIINFGLRPSTWLVLQVETSRMETFEPKTFVFSSAIWLLYTSLTLRTVSAAMVPRNSYSYVVNKNIFKVFHFVNCVTQTENNKRKKWMMINETQT